VHAKAIITIIVENKIKKKKGEKEKIMKTKKTRPKAD
jgi:hypothetical protein